MLAGLPPHHLILKVGCPVVMLRNYDPSRGLCNGTRLIVTKLHDRAVSCQVLSGLPHHRGKVFCIPPITLTDDTLPCNLTRVQLPLKLAFAMTINKSQGQSLQSVGLFLPEPVFSHGQLYVALSRVSRPDDIHCLLTPGKHHLDDQDAHITTMNIVYPEVLL